MCIVNDKVVLSSLKLGFLRMVPKGFVRYNYEGLPSLNPIFSAFSNQIMKILFVSDINLD